MEKLTLEKIYYELEREVLSVKDSIYEPLKLDKDIIQKLLPWIIGRGKIVNYLDFEGVCFDGINVTFSNLSEAKNVDLDPQTVEKKSFYHTKLNGNFAGKSFEGVNVEYADFTKTENVDLDPQTVAYKSLKGTVLKGNFAGKSFDDVDVEDTDFTNATNIEDEVVLLHARIRNYFKEYKRSSGK